MQGQSRQALGPADIHARALAYAREHLQALGYQLLAERYRSRHGSCDLIAALDGRLLFVEVVAGRLAAVDAEQSPGARRRLRLAASAWLWQNPQRNLIEVRFDMVRVWLARDGELVGTEHWPNAY